MDKPIIITKIKAPKNPFKRTQVIRATLYHLNGFTSQIVMNMPNYSLWSEGLERASMMMNDYIFYMASRWVHISKFQVEVGSLDKGEFVPGPFQYREKEIPLGKVFLPGKRGKWVSLDEAKDIKLKGDAGC